VIRLDPNRPVRNGACVVELVAGDLEHIGRRKGAESQLDSRVDGIHRDHAVDIELVIVDVGREGAMVADQTPASSFVIGYVLPSSSPMTVTCCAFGASLDADEIAISRPHVADPPRDRHPTASRPCFAAVGGRFQCLSGDADLRLPMFSAAATGQRLATSPHAGCAGRRGQRRAAAGEVRADFSRHSFGSM
jgi:hypothetical protein